MVSGYFDFIQFSSFRKKKIHFFLSEEKSELFFQTFFTHQTHLVLKETNLWFAQRLHVIIFFITKLYFFLCIDKKQAFGIVLKEREMRLGFVQYFPVVQHSLPPPNHTNTQ